MDCFVAEFIIGPAKGRTRWLLAMTKAVGWAKRKRAHHLLGVGMVGTAQGAFAHPTDSFSNKHIFAFPRREAPESFM
jgi:hypothetical protein